METQSLEYVDVILPWSNNIRRAGRCKLNEVDLQPLARQLYEESPGSSFFLTINPYDLVSNRSLVLWKDMVYKAQYKFMCDAIKNMVNQMECQLIMTFEISDKGRFHAHAVMSFKDRRDNFFFKERCRKIFSSKKHPHVAVDMYPLTNSFLEICSKKQMSSGLNYLTKDVGYMLAKGFKPLLRIDTMPKDKGPPQEVRKLRAKYGIYPDTKK